MPTATRRTQIQMPDEYLPPNKVLFLQNLPEGTTKEDLQDVFEQYVPCLSFECLLSTSTNSPPWIGYGRHPNLLEVRLIPNKRDIAFVEYADEGSATVAKDALHNFKIDGETKMKVRVSRYNYAFECAQWILMRHLSSGHLREEVRSRLDFLQRHRTERLRA